jgi:GWxTD domain-containing protein
MKWAIPLQDLWRAEYQVTVRLHAGERELQARGQFSLLAESDVALDAFFRESLAVLKYIASDEEVRVLEMAAPDERRAAWDAFWERRNPDPDQDTNVYKEEFFRRLRYANEKFSSVRPGWQTDRGRVYIIHGHPDDISRGDSHNWGSPATEIWYYDHLGVSFVFVDRTGYGDYELMSTGR